MRNEEIFNGDEIILLAWMPEIKALKKELAGQKMTHKQLLELMKERGIPGKYYARRHSERR